MSKPAAPTKNTNFIEVKSEEQFKNILKENKFVAIDFTATWCGPCKAIGPVFQKLSESHPSIVFLKVDVDQFSSIAKEYDVRAMPTFVFVEVGKKPETLVGANKLKLESHLVALSKKAIPQGTANVSTDGAANDKPATDASADKPTTDADADKPAASK
ncbi:hypothetical protein H4R24_005270 [Coemansia sp. RSA 988]|nr:hypothetical protein H4R24_005270 [Coemansia sp. RSA 988]